tara:strand:- start:5478 stop:5714 length:237 start_codon:yes stop_codon:yes gene_type:complete
VAQKNVVVVAEGTDKQSFAKLKVMLENCGLRVEDIFPEIGTLVGIVDDSQLEALSILEGVASISEEDVIHLPEPGKPQ